MSAVGATSRGAGAFGAAAVGALAVGAAAIGRLAVGRARVRRLEIDELIVGRARLGGGRVAHERALDWIDRYEAAWRAPGTDALGTLFTDDATYHPGPYRPALEGIAAIARFWEDGRESPDEPFAMRRELVAVDGDVAVARVDVDYERPTPHGFRNLWVIAFAPDGRCRSFEEWPFAPERQSPAAP